MKQFNPPRPLILALSLIVLLVSCTKKAYKDYFYETTGIMLFNADNSAQSPVTDSDSVPIAAYAIRMDLTIVVKDSTGEGHFGRYQNEDQVTSFDISSTSEFNGIPAGQSLNQFFNYSDGAGIGEVIRPNSYAHIFYHQPSQGTTSITTKYLMLMDPPQESGVYSFVIKAEFNDGHVLTDTTTVNLYQ